MTGPNRLREGVRTSRPIVLTSHPAAGGAAPPVQWGAADPVARGPIVATLTDPAACNAIGTHSGAYSLYRALAVAAGQLRADHRPDFSDTRPAVPIGPFPQWADPRRIVSLDPWGHVTSEAFAARIAAGCDIRPTVAVTRARLNMPEIDLAIRAGFEQTGGMFPELVTRPDLRVFLPPIGGASVYLFGDPALLGRPETRVACRIHDECNGSDVFGSDICTCRPYLAHGVEVCIAMAQRGGAGIMVYNRKEGRALGEVTKFLVYNARKRQEGGDRADAYFLRTECVAGVSDMRFQELMPDVLHWLGVTRIDELVSMSNMKFGPIVASGIEVVKRVPIPDGLIPADAQVEMDAKKAAGYFAETVPDAEELKLAKGRGLLG